MTSLSPIEISLNVCINGVRMQIVFPKSLKTTPHIIIDYLLLYILCNLPQCSVYYNNLEAYSSFIWNKLWRPAFIKLEKL